MSWVIGIVCEYAVRVMRTGAAMLVRHRGEQQTGEEASVSQTKVSNSDSNWTPSILISQTSRV